MKSDPCNKPDNKFQTSKKQNNTSRQTIEQQGIHREKISISEFLI